jgi:hypothetical protein
MSTTTDYTNLTTIIRRANLFNIDSLPQFVTFSNYGESITGTSVAVNSKIYPSAFMCLFVNGLDTEESLRNFIKVVLVGYYESKLATGRDAFQDSLSMTEKTIKPLDILLQAIEAFDPEFKVKYISDIVEQDYNGVWSDFMCSINLNNVSNDYEYVVNKVDKSETIDKDTKKVLLPESLDLNCPYNWSTKEASGDDEYFGPATYQDVKMILDDASERLYNFNTYIKSITLEKISGEAPDTLSFNVLIPLFDRIIDNPSTPGETSAHSLYVHTNATEEGTVYEAEPDDLTEKSETLYNTLVPYGMWFPGLEPISIHYNTNTATSNYIQPTWTLTLSSQFKPFPYSNQYTPSEINNGTSSSDESLKPELHDTFAQVLSMQNKMMQKLDEYNNTITSLQNEINLLKNNQN